jgi:hypothetical protein
VRSYLYTYGSLSRMQIEDPLRIRIISHNIRYATKSPFKGEEKWHIRRPYLTSELIFNIRHCPAALIGLQEVLDNQLEDILSDLQKESPNW